MAYDLRVSNFASPSSTLVFFLDVLQIRRVSMTSRGTQIFIPGNNNPRPFALADDVTYAVRHEVDTVANTWKISVNGASVFTGAVGSQELQCVRFYINSTRTDAAVYLGNIAITGTAIPEPTALALAAMGVLLILRRRRC